MHLLPIPRGRCIHRLSPPRIRAYRRLGPAPAGTGWPHSLGPRFAEKRGEREVPQLEATAGGHSFGLAEDQAHNLRMCGIPAARESRPVRAAPDSGWTVPVL